jgi:hypothetical protein
MEWGKEKNQATEYQILIRYLFNTREQKGNIYHLKNNAI